MVRLDREEPAGQGPLGESSAGEGPGGHAAVADHHGEEMPRARFTRRQLLLFGVFVISSVAFLYLVLPKLLGLQDTWNRIRAGNGWWFGLGAVLEGCSFFGYVALFRSVFVSGGARGTGARSAATRSAGTRSGARINWRESYQITMAGLAATRLFAAAGAGGVALTAWALRRSGLPGRVVASRMIAFMALLYGVYMATMVIDGLGLYLGLFPGPSPFAITVIPAIFGAAAIGLFLAVSLVPGDLDGVVGRLAARDTRRGRIAERLAAAPAAASSGVREAIALVRGRDPHLLGAVAWWGFDIAVLWACFHAFGASPPKAAIVMAYFVGMIGNTLPLPGGIGGVDGGMIGAFTAFDVSVQVSVVAVLAYRALAFWLPTLPGAVAYLQLRRTVSRWRTADTPTYS